MVPKLVNIFIRVRAKGKRGYDEPEIEVLNPGSTPLRKRIDRQRYLLPSPTFPTATRPTWFPRIHRICPRREKYIRVSGHQPVAGHYPIDTRQSRKSVRIKESNEKYQRNSRNAQFGSLRFRQFIVSVNRLVCFSRRQRRGRSCGFRFVLTGSSKENHSRASIRAAMALRSVFPPDGCPRLQGLRSGELSRRTHLPYSHASWRQPGRR